MSEPRHLTERALRDQFLDLAERYETVLALDLADKPDDRARTKPGSRVPPGMQAVLDEDEARHAVAAVDDLAEFLAHVLADELDVAAPSPTTPARLRLAGEHAGHFIVDDDLPDTDDHGLLALGVQDDVRDALTALRRIAGRGVRKVRTVHRCHTGCGGQYVSPLGTSHDRHDDSLRCERCGHEVAHEVWSRWPRARVQYVSADHAAKMLGTTVAAVWQRAKRHKWRRVGSGADVRYFVDDIKASGESVGA